MADENEEKEVVEQDSNNDEGGKEKKSVNLGFFSSGLVGILKVVGIGLFIIILSIITSLLVYKIAGRGTASAYYNTVEYFKGTQEEEYDWYDPTQGSGLKGVTNDPTKKTFIIELFIAYPLGDEGVKNEIIQKRVPIIDILLSWFGSETSDYLRDIRNREEIRASLKSQLKQLMSTPDVIKDVRFSGYQILDS